jgi:hypothetical protein
LKCFSKNLKNFGEGGYKKGDIIKLYIPKGKVDPAGRVGM